MKTSSKKASPHVVAEWSKSANEVVRVCLQKYKGHEILSIRVWFQKSNNEFRPGTNGINLSVAKHATKIRRAVKKAEKIALEREDDHA